MFDMLGKLDIKEAEINGIKPMLRQINGHRMLVIENNTREKSGNNTMQLQIEVIKRLT